MNEIALEIIATIEALAKDPVDSSKYSSSFVGGYIAAMAHIRTGLEELKKKYTEDK